MRFSILIIYCVLSPFWSSAQTELNFLQPHASWLVERDYTETIWGFDALERYFLGQDSWVSDTLYRTLWQSNLLRYSEPGGLEQFVQPFVPSDSLLVGVVRETLGRKVYFRAALEEGGFDTEILLYDFTLDEGDTFMDADGQVFTVNLLTIEERYGAMRRVWLFDNGAEVIEGVGGLQGPVGGLEILLSLTNFYLYDYCTTEDMDCNIAVDQGLVHPLRQTNVDNETGGFFGGSVTTEQYRFQGDTLIEGETFLRLFKSEDIDLTEWQHTGVYFRQEGSRVYRLSSDFETSPVLLYDFSFIVGDTIRYFSPFTDDNALLEVKAIETVLLRDGQARKLFRLGYREGVGEIELNWVEGIGSLGDFVHPAHELFVYPVVDIHNRFFRCHFIDYREDWAYRTDSRWEGPCYIYIVTTEEIGKAPIVELYPNPASDYLQIVGDVQNSYLYLYNLWGQQVARYDLNIPILDIKPLPAGVYFFQIKDARTLRSIAQGKWQKL